MSTLDRHSKRWGASLVLAALAGAALAAGACQRAARDGGAPAVLHLADRLGEAAVEGAAAPAARTPRVWRFDAPRPEWEAVAGAGPVRLERLPDGVRLSLLPAAQAFGPLLVGGIAVDLGELRFDDWEAVHVRARTRDRLGAIAVSYNLDEEGAVPDPMAFVLGGASAPPVFSDGSVQTYALPLAPRGGKRPAVLRDLGIFAGAPGPAGVDILSVSLVPRGAELRRPPRRAGDDRGGRPPARLSMRARRRR